MKLTRIALCIAITIVLSCNPENDIYEGNSIAEISESLLPMLFAPGSSWTYTNADSSSNDEVVLELVVADTLGPYKGTGTFQVYDYTYHSQQYGQYSDFYIGYVIKTSFVGDGYKYLSSHKLGDSVENAKILAIYDSLTICGSLYKEVVLMDISTDSDIDQNMRLYYVDSIGIVRKEIQISECEIETWDLIYYNVSLIRE